MRCPKCGYITFDHMDTCLKCKKNISGADSTAAGTTYHAAAPSFLRFSKAADTVEEEDSGLTVAMDSDESSFEFSDPDLNVLSDETEDFVFTENDEEEVEEVEKVEEETEAFVSLEEDEFLLESDDDIGLGLDEETSTAAFAVPDELSDISDLAPPAQEAEEDVMELSLDEDLSADSSMDLDGFDLDLDLGLGDDDGQEVEVEVESLSLDDIDLSEEEIGSEDSDLDGLNMDLDLDLNLGGAEDDVASNKDEAPDSLDGLSLSLD